MDKFEFRNTLFHESWMVCGACKYYASTCHKDGSCHFQPPSVVGFPSVKFSDWCSEWVPMNDCGDWTRFDNLEYGDIIGGVGIIGKRVRLDLVARFTDELKRAKEELKC